LQPNSVVEKLRTGVDNWNLQTRKPRPFLKRKFDILVACEAAGDRKIPVSRFGPDCPLAIDLLIGTVSAYHAWVR